MKPVSLASLCDMSFQCWEQSRLSLEYHPLPLTFTLPARGIFFTATWASNLAPAFPLASSRFESENQRLVVSVTASSFEPQLAESHKSAAMSRHRMNEACRGGQATKYHNFHLNKNESFRAMVEYRYPSSEAGMKALV
jgi:hypothetical protein